MNALRLIRSNRLLAGTLGYMNIRDPIPLSTRQTRLLFLSVKTDGLPTQLRRVKVLKCVDVNDSVDMIRDVTRDNRNRSAAGTNVKDGRLGSKHVPRNQVSPPQGH